MRNLTNGTATVAAWTLVIVVLAAGSAPARVVLASRGPSYHAAPSDHEIVLEAGLAEPLGDQDEPYAGSLVGFGAGTGYEVGARWRQWLGGALAVSPAFHYTRFGTDTGVDAFGGYYRRVSLYRYGLDLQAFVGEPGDQVRAFVSGGVGLANNRLYDEDDTSYYQDTVNTLVASVGAGLKLRNLELSGEYTRNRFATAKFSSPVERDYNWDQFVVRLGIAFGR